MFCSVLNALKQEVQFEGVVVIEDAVRLFLCKFPEICGKTTKGKVLENNKQPHQRETLLIWEGSL